jgi:1,4-alpha-glucan branching enzyme
VPSCSFYAEILNTDAVAYGGSGMGNMGGLEAEPVPWHGLPFSLNLTLPPLAAVYLEPGAPPDSCEDRDEWQD